MTNATCYAPLTLETLSQRLGTLAILTRKLGSDPMAWQVREIGDGNLNLVFIVEGPEGSAIVKQALPYVRLVGDSGPLPLKRAFFEQATLTRQAKYAPDSVPEIWYFDEEQAIIIMEYLTPHVILRKKLIAGEKVAGLASALGGFCARTAFRGSDLSLDAPQKKADVALFSGNVELMAITESLVFTDPYFDAPRNHHTKALEGIITQLRTDTAMKSQVQQALFAFTTRAETLCHGDLHTGSVMCTETQTKIIDPEFGFYGPMGFDIGMLIANYLMAYFSQPAHRSADLLPAYQAWLLEVIATTYVTFQQEFDNLWHNERKGILFPHTLFEDQGQSTAIALQALHQQIWQDALCFCGIEMHRRTLSLAHNADFESITDEMTRAHLEARNLMMGRDLILKNRQIADIHALTSMAAQYNQEDIL